MAFAQTQFEKFHTVILLGYDENSELRDRRDTLLKDLKDRISPDAPTYSHFTQGSYALSTGVTALNGNPDMDIGLSFNCSPDDYEDPLTLKKFVSDALTRTNRTVTIRRPCVTVTYLKDGEPTHHIDLAVYSSNSDDQTQLARGRDCDPKAERVWEASEAKKLTDLINNQFKDDDSNQFRRVVRALKRWRDEKIGHKNVPSIGLTVSAYQWFSPSYDSVEGKPRDLIAIRNLVDKMLANWNGLRLVVELPVASYADLFERMTQIQMVDFKSKLESLRDALNEAEGQPDTHEACKILKKQFGDDFPVPEKTDTTKKTSAGVSTSGRSA
ncbi:cyclic GMP-AMP synthase DncV-like nucleotidyltransferase [uncultured Deefgea sp.]|uniref:cyclic GMP-AMP synthase DncV-like nucleotidyltransferase n=1 Tax=uncultured Deefgea sp. TaxID=1304914 RepID=UPI00259133AD|nr:hypothetical protein [uncultured Deefgea sp.]